MFNERFECLDAVFLCLPHVLKTVMMFTVTWSHRELLSPQHQPHFSLLADAKSAVIVEFPSDSTLGSKADMLLKTTRLHGRLSDGDSPEMF